jgi:DNA adenine methylase
LNGLVQVDPDTLTDLERAARFLYLQRAAFGGHAVKQHFGVDFNGGARFNLTKLVPMLEDVHERLAGVLIERLPYADCIKRYDSRPGTLFYCDPPYWGCTDDYGKDIFTSRFRGSERPLSGPSRTLHPVDQRQA